MSKELVYLSKNKGKSVVALTLAQYTKSKEYIEKDGYRKLTDTEVKEYLKKQGFVEAKPIKTKDKDIPQKSKQEKSTKQ